MILPGLVIEYLITGATAFLWMWFLLHLLPMGLRPNMLDTLDSAKLTLMVPFAYVVGMIIDFASRLVTNALEWLLVQRALWPLRRMISAALPDQYQNLKRAFEPRKRDSAPLSQQQVLIASGELGKQLEMRSSRDRVARGAFLNALIGTAFVTSYYAANRGTQIYSKYILMGGLVLASLLFAMWYRFDHLTHRYRRKAGEAIQEKESVSIRKSA